MTAISRRRFLNQTKTATVGLTVGPTILANAASVRGTPQNDKVVLCSVGVGGRGSALAHGFLERDDCEIGYVADVDTRQFRRADDFAKQQGGRRPKTVQDLRRALDDKDVDAVVIATPDHWHALATIWACQAGKDVYVEKPPSQNCWEGRKMVEAARHYEQIVQVGTQNRSAPYNLAAKQYIDEGKLGRIHLCRVYNQKGGIGNATEISYPAPPKELNWDMWNGPAPESRYSPQLHGDWHAWWRYSGGDLANDGVHQLDLARWLCGVEYPKSVYCSGGTFASQGIRDVPDTQVATYDFDNLTMTCELTLFGNYMLKTDGGVRNSDTFPYWLQNATRIEIYGEEALMVVGRHGGGWQVFVRPKSRQPVVESQCYGRFPDPEHKENFLVSIRSRALPSADIEKAQRSALLVHYANVSYRLGGKKLQIDPATEEFVDDREAMRLFGREYRHPWVIPQPV